MLLYVDVNIDLVFCSLGFWSLLCPWFLSLFHLTFYTYNYKNMFLAFRRDEAMGDGIGTAQGRADRVCPPRAGSQTHLPAVREVEPGRPRQDTLVSSMDRVLQPVLVPPSPSGTLC